MAALEEPNISVNHWRDIEAITMDRVESQGIENITTAEIISCLNSKACQARADPIPDRVELGKGEARIRINQHRAIPVQPITEEMANKEFYLTNKRRCNFILLLNY